MSNMRKALCAIALLLLGAAAAAEEPAVDDAAKTESLVKAMADGTPEKRDAAEKELAAMGSRALPILEKIRGGQNEDLARRADRLCRRIRVRMLVPPTSFAEVLDADSVELFIEIPDPALSLSRFRGSPLYRLWKEEACADFFKARMAKEPPFRKKYADALAELAASMSGPQAWFLAASSLKGGDEWVVPHAVLIQGPAEAARFSSATDIVSGCMSEKVEKLEEMAGLTVEAMFDSYRLRTDDFLAWCTTKPLMEKLLGWIKQPPAGALAKTDAWRRAREWAGKDFDAIAFTRRGGIALLAPDPETAGAKMLRKFFAEGMLSAAACVSFTAEGTTERLRVETDGKGGIWGAMAPCDPAAAPIAAVPASACLAVEIRMDVGKTHERIAAMLQEALGEKDFREAIEGFEENAAEWGFSLWDIAALAKGPAVAAVLPVPPAEKPKGDDDEDEEETSPISIMIAVAARDRKALLEKLERKAIGDEAVLKRSELDGCILYMNKDDASAPAMLVKGDLFVFMSHRRLAGTVAKTLSGRSPKLADNDAFRSWRQELPREALLAAYLDSRALAACTHGFLKEEFGVGPRAEKFPPKEVFEKYLGQGHAVVIRDGNAFEITAKSPLPFEMAVWLIGYVIIESAW